MVIYLDGFMGLNFLIDWLLLLGVNRLAGFPPGFGRTAAAAAVGGGYAGMCLVPGFAFLSSGLWRGVSLAVMSATAFGLNRTVWPRGLLFLLLSMALGGLAVSFDTGHFWGLGLCALALALLCRMSFRDVGRKLVEVSIGHGGKSLRLLALRDTGNTLRDPVTGESVLVVDASIGRQLLGLEVEELSNPVEVLKRYPGMRLIPYHTVGNSGGFLLAQRCDRVVIDGHMSRGLVAFAPEAFPQGGYQGLTGGQYG